MNTTVFTENLKKFRLAKKMTQEYVADALCVNTQTVSRWECGTTLPDVMMLPELAKLYSVTVDDFYKESSVAYDNYAQRLSAVYEKTKAPEDFMHCRIEYIKMMKNGELSTRDKWEYATIHHFMLRYCKDVALEWYDKAIADGSESDPHIYRRARSLKIGLMHELGKTEEIIAEQEKKCSLAHDDPEEWVYLLEAYINGKRYEEALSCFEKAIEKFPENWLLYIHGGDVCQYLKKYDEAFSYWEKAGELGTYFHDELYCMACCYDEIGEYEKAYALYMEISEKLHNEHYHEEAEMAEKFAADIKKKMEK